LWFSGFLFQFMAVMFGIHLLSGLVEWRPANALVNSLRSHMRDADRCTRIFRDQRFTWDRAQGFTPPVKSRGAEFARLVYMNRGIAGEGTNGSLLYRISFEAEVKNLNNGLIKPFAPFGELFFEVSPDSRILGCLMEVPIDTSTEGLQTMVRKPCEEKGWIRRMLCDKGSDRCEPLSQCEHEAKDRGAS
jgi:hypothetical protein